MGYRWVGCQWVVVVAGASAALGFLCPAQQPPHHPEAHQHCRSTRRLQRHHLPERYCPAAAGQGGEPHALGSAPSNP